MNSLRRAILFRMAGLLLLVGIVSAAATYFYVRDETQATFDAQIRQVATYMDALALSVGDAKAPPAPAGAEDLFLVQIWDSAGKLTWTSGGPATAEVPTAPGYSESVIGTGHFRSYTSIKPERIIRVSLPLDERNEQASTAALQIALPMALVIPLSWLLLSVMINRIMGRLDRAAWRIGHRKADDLSEVPDDGLPAEVRPFVASINGLVGRLNENAEAQKRFVADAAHELRTPLTAIGIQITNLETALTTKTQHERLAPLKEGAQRANYLVGQLLQLAHSERPQAGVQERTGIASVFASLNAAFQPIAHDRGVELVFLPGGAAFEIEQNDAKLVLGALIENALAYTPASGRVTVSADAQGVTVLDDGPGIAPEKLPHVFERFYRASGSAVPGTGLGLAIAKAICDRQGWRLQIENRADRNGVRAVLKVKTAST